MHQLCFPSPRATWGMEKKGSQSSYEFLRNIDTLPTTHAPDAGAASRSARLNGYNCP